MSVRERIRQLQGDYAVALAIQTVAEDLERMAAALGGKAEEYPDMAEGMIVGVHVLLAAAKGYREQADTTLTACGRTTDDP